MKKISFAALVFAILAFLISSSFAIDKLKKGPVKIVPKKDLPPKKIKPLEPFLTKVKTKLQRRGSLLYLMVSPRPEKVELYYGKKHLKTWGQGSKFDITPYLSESRKEFRFVFYDPIGMTQSQDVSVSKYIYLVKKPPQKLQPKKKPEVKKPPKLLPQKPKKLKPGLPPKKIKKPPAKKTEEPYIHIERVYLKNDRIHVALRNTGAGNLSVAEQDRGRIRVRSKSLNEFWTPFKIDATMKAFDFLGKGIDFDTELQLQGLETVWVILENIRGDLRKVAILKPELEKKMQKGLKRPRLAITRVQVEGSGPVRYREETRVNVTVSNNGLASATITIYIDGSSASSDLVLHPGSVRVVPLRVLFNKRFLEENLVRPEDNRVSIKAVIGSPRLDEIVDYRGHSVFKDNNLSDNIREQIVTVDPGSLQYELFVIFHQFFVFDDCDFDSDGEWRIIAHVEPMDGSGLYFSRYWPDRSTLGKVKSGNFYHWGRGESLHLSGTDSFAISGRGLECDAKRKSRCNFGATIRDEAIDYLGNLSRIISPREWRRRGFSYEVSPRGGECRANVPFVLYVNIRNVELRD